MSKSITNIIKSSLKRKDSIFSRNALNQLQMILRDRTTKIYHHEILLIYQHCSVSKDEAAFRVIDSLIFPPRNKVPLLQPSFILAYRRLYCLVRYQLPYTNWLDKVRQLLHQEDNLTLNHLKLLLVLCKLNHMKFMGLYRQALGILDESLENYHLFEIGYLKKYLKRIYSAESKNLMMKINRIYDSNEGLFFNSYLRNLVKSHEFNERWLFYYLIKLRKSPLRYCGFLVLSMLNDQNWKKWFTLKYSRQQMFDKLPYPMKWQVNQNTLHIIFSNLYYDRPYIDQYCKLEEVVIDGKKKIKLKQPEQTYNLFLLNAFYYLDSQLTKVDSKVLDRIEQVLEQSRYLRKNGITFYIYVSVKLKIIYFRELTSQQRTRLQIILIKQFKDKIKNINPKYVTLIKNERILPMRSIKLIAMLEFPVYRTEEFKQFLNKSLELFEAFSFSSLTFKNLFKSILKIIHQYQKSSIYPQNKIICTQFKRALNKNLPDYEIFYSNEVEINDKIEVDCLIKIHHIKSQKQFKLLVDFRKVEEIAYSWHFTKSSNLWKEGYLKKWCRLQYRNEQHMPIYQYIEGEQFEKIVHNLQKNNEK